MRQAKNRDFVISTTKVLQTAVSTAPVLNTPGKASSTCGAEKISSNSRSEKFHKDLHKKEEFEYQEDNHRNPDIT